MINVSFQTITSSQLDVRVDVHNILAKLVNVDKLQLNFDKP